MEGFDTKNKRIGVFETVELKDGEGNVVEVKAKVDTGADRTSIDAGLAEKTGLTESGKYSVYGKSG
jgi:hypothetical protein